MELEDYITARELTITASFNRDGSGFGNGFEDGLGDGDGDSYGFYYGCGDGNLDNGNGFGKGQE